MTAFAKKRGAVGWPGPQARQIEGWAKRFAVDVERRAAQTGSVYLTLISEGGEEISVRVADHADAYCTATFTVDPAIDQRAAVKEWIEAHGDESAWKAAAARKREFRRLVKAAGPWALMNGGGQWYPWAEDSAPNERDLERVRHQITHGYAADRLSADWKGE